MIPHRDSFAIRFSITSFPDRFLWVNPMPSSLPDLQEKRLDRLPIGQRARIREVVGTDGLAVRLMEMGILDGEEIETLGKAPLGDPIEYLIRGYRLSLRIVEAQRVLLE